MLGYPHPNKEHLPCQSSTLHALWASSGHESNLVSTTPLASYHASCGIMPTVRHFPARGFCFPQL